MTSKARSARRRIGGGFKPGMHPTSISKDQTP